MSLETISTSRDQLSGFLNEVFADLKQASEVTETGTENEPDAQRERGGEGIKTGKKRTKTTKNPEINAELRQAYQSVQDVLDVWADEHFGDRVPEGVVDLDQVEALCIKVDEALTETESIQKNKLVLKYRKKFKEFLENYDTNNVLAQLSTTDACHSDNERTMIDPRKIADSKETLPLGNNGRSIVLKSVVKKLILAKPHLRFSRELSTAAGKTTALSAEQIQEALAEIFRGNPKAVIMTA